MADLLTNLAAVAGAAGGDGAYIEDVFSTYLYTGNGSTQTITNGIDLDGEGGLVWIKCRTTAYDNELADTNNGAGYYLSSNQTDAKFGPDSNALSAFNSDGFSVGGNNAWNQSGQLFASWTFRKAPKFFDVVTYTGTGANRTVSHNLGSVPGCIMVKRTDTTGDWQVYHRANTANPETDYLVLNTAAATVDSNTRWNDTAPTDAVFSLGTEATVNASGGTYVAYLFAHDDGGFGDDGEQNVISCGSFTTDASAQATINLGYEPQWVLTKVDINSANSFWVIQDSMRGFPVSTGATLAALYPNANNAETTGGNITPYTVPTSTGFRADVGSAAFFGNKTCIYIAIRRGPMKTPTAGTEVFSPTVYTGTNLDNRLINTSLLTDMVMIKERNDTVEGMVTGERLRGNPYLLTGTDAAENTDADTFMTPTLGVGNAFSAMNGVGVGNDATSKVNIDTTANNQIAWAFRRAPGFFDVVCYTATGSALTVNHNLDVIPEIILFKKRDGTGPWVFMLDFAVSDFYQLNMEGNGAGETRSYGLFLNSRPTATSFEDAGTYTGNFVAYLFASLPGISKVGSYTGNGTSVSVTTGFQPRFILVKRTSSTGNWVVGDSARGLVAGNDPFVELNAAASETTNEDWVDVSATGFTINETTENLNVNAATYIYLCVA